MRWPDETYIWILLGKEGDVKGAFLSEKDLKDGVDYWMKLNPNETLSYSEWTANYPAEPNSWEWAYIAPDSIPYALASGGGSVPQRHYWGKNLIGVIWDKIPDWEAAYV